MLIRINGVDRQSTANIPTTEPQGTYVLADNPNLYEVQRTNNFEFVITGLNNILRAGANGTETNATIPNAQEVLRISVSSAPIPHFSQSTITIRRGNSVVKFAGVPEFSSGTIVLNDYIGADTKAVLMAWRICHTMYRLKGGLVGDSRRCLSCEYTPDYQPVRKWRLYGCWISSLSESDYSHESNEKHQITATIEYDKAVIDMSEID